MVGGGSFLRFFVLAALLVWGTGEARAWERWDEGCNQASCHGDYYWTNPYLSTKGGTWPDSLHEVHADSKYMNIACDVCHVDGTWLCTLDSSKGTANSPPYGCNGCHGRLYNNQPLSFSQVILHENAGVNCVTSKCHANLGSPYPETSTPPYYGNPDSNVDFPCNNDAQTSEDWSGDGQGLDNDGDGLYDSADPDCGAAVCGNSAIESGETCDPPATCPTSCNDGDDCTEDIMSGQAADCNVSCANPVISSCINNDGCCPGICHANNDNDCAPVCGNSVVEAGETCDPPATCPSSCSDGDDCTEDVLSGQAAECDVVCTNPVIDTCTHADGCCPAGCDSTNDNDCTSVCGNGVLEIGETCDPPASCPSSCSDGDVCTQDVMTGAAADCDVLCANPVIDTCIHADGCCPAGCNNTNDSDCAVVCDNGVVESGETCDPRSSCPSSCADADPCTQDIMSGQAADCNVTCSNPAISACTNGDGCCPAACDSGNDSDCSASCNNGVIDAGETCDPPATCPTSCNDNDPCSQDVMTGSAANCNVTCGYTPVSDCISGDQCCPTGCHAINDGDCLPNCGNGVVEVGETCDPPATCPNTCDDLDACSQDSLAGSAANCDAVCMFDAITACVSGDQCCPSGCDSVSDSDCNSVCGNGVLESGETCDPPSTCPSSCDDQDPCSQDIMRGSSQDCNVSCEYLPITACVSDDGCCPPGCNTVTDNDCTANCGNGVIEAGETCDPPATCPSSCDDGNPCSQDSAEGSAAECNLLCTHAEILACLDADGCCPAGCAFATDNDCSASCNDGVIDPGETCDPAATCPTDCDDNNPCSQDSMSGSPENCNSLCSHFMITACLNDDGCCPSLCDAVRDNDCQPSCGNWVVESGETCDPSIRCPYDCDDGNACTRGILNGDKRECTAACSYETITACIAGDDCCPAGCHSGNDDDCSLSCGDGVIDFDETCDPPSSCPTTCDDGDSCSQDTMVGSRNNCNVACVHVAIELCQDGDGCCPTYCHARTDADCSSACGNGRIDLGETCDPPSSCPSSCDDGNICTTDRMSGTAADCSAYCHHGSISECISGDLCCPVGCSKETDADCLNANPSADGCGCSAGKPRSLAGWILLLLLLPISRRRRR